MEKDPAVDREEFVIRLKNIFNPCSGKFVEESLHALLTNDLVKIDDMKKRMSDCKDKIDSYLKKWDEAKTEEEKRRVVGSVKA